MAEEGQFGNQLAHVDAVAWSIAQTVEKYVVIYVS